MKPNTPAQHTPTPWKEIGANLNADIEIVSGGECTCVVRTLMSDTKNKRQHANAAFIVRAVNNIEAVEAENKRLRDSHEELVKAAQWALTELENVLKESGGCDHAVGICACTFKAKLEDLFTALLKAKGR